MAWAVIPSRPTIVSAREQGVHDGGLDRLDRRLEQRGDRPVHDHPGLDDRARGIRRGAGRAQPAVAGRERDEQVARAVRRDRAHPRQPEARSLGEPLALVGQERRVRREDDDDRAAAGPDARAGQPGAASEAAIAASSWSHALGTSVTRDRLAHRDAVDPQQLPRRRSSPGRARPTVQPPSASGTRREAVPIPPLNSWQDHPGRRRRRCPRSTGPPARGDDGRVDMLGRHVEAVDVVERPVVRLAHDRQRPVHAVPPFARAAWATSASWTTPTECVLVIPIDAAQQPRLADPLEAGELAVAVEPVAAREHGLGPDVVLVRDDDRDPGPDGPLADHERPVAARSASCGRPGRPATSVIASSSPGSSRPIRRPSSRARIRPPPAAPASRSARPPPYHRRVCIDPGGPVAAAPPRAVPRRRRRAPAAVARRRRADGRGRGVPRPARAWRCSRARGPGRTGRWSYLAADPVAVLEAPAEGPDPFAEARCAAAPDRRAAVPGRRRRGPPFAGGLVGYLGYDLGPPVRAAAELCARVDQHLPLLRLALHDWAIAWDRRTGEAWLGGAGGRRRRATRRSGAGSRSTRARACLGGYLPDPRPVPTCGPSSTAPDPAAFRVRDLAPRLDGAASRRSARRSGGARSTRRTSPAGSRRRSAATRGRCSAGCGPATRRCSRATWTSAPSPATGAPRALLSASPEPFLAVDADGTRQHATRSRARGRGAGRATRTGRWPASCSRAPRTRPRT